MGETAPAKGMAFGKGRQDFSGCLRGHILDTFLFWENGMKREIGSYEAKTRLPELLRLVKAGQSFTITNRGKAVADLVPSEGLKIKDKAAAAEKLKAFMAAEPVHGVDIKALVSEGRA